MFKKLLQIGALALPMFLVACSGSSSTGTVNGSAAEGTEITTTPASFATSISVVLPVPRREARRGTVTRLEGGMGGRDQRALRPFVLDKLSETAIFALANRPIQNRNRVTDLGHVSLPIPGK